MWAFLVILIAILFGLLRYRETFVVKMGDPMAEQELISFDPSANATRVFGLSPDTCKGHKPQLQNGLCYAKCDDGYNGEAHICWANTTFNGFGKLPSVHGCSHYSGEGWARCRDDGLGSLWEDLQCSTYCDGNWSWSDGGFCHTKCGGCGCIKKNLFQRQYCADGGDLVDALCYPKCPADKPNRMPGLPTMCYKGSKGFSYERGLGDIPHMWTFESE